MMPIDESRVVEFWQNGYLLVPQVFSAEEVQAFQSEVIALRRDPANYDCYVPSRALYFRGTLSNYEGLQQLIFDQRLTSIAKKLLGGTIAYFGDSNFQMGEGSRRFHRDNVDRTNVLGPDWEGRYPLIRFGLYLGDFDAGSGGLKVVPGSNNLRVVKLAVLLRKYLGKAAKLFSGPLARILDLSSFFRAGRTLPLRVGDVVVWHFRTLHSGNAVRLKRFVNLPLPTWLEERVPASWALPGAGERIAIFLSYGSAGSDLDRYLRHRQTTDESVWEISHWDSQLEARARDRGLVPIKPTENYGQSAGSVVPVASERPVQKA